jgi:hypothetical protein
MVYVQPTPSDLQTFLGVDSVDVSRATYLLTAVTSRLQSYVNPLPDGAYALAVEIAAQAYARPLLVKSETTGPYTVVPGGGGIFITKAQIRELRLMANKGSAFTIDPTPVGAGSGLSPWDTNVTWLEGVPIAEDMSLE